MKKDIYIIKNDINNKIYIGQSVDVKNKWNHHLSNANMGKTIFYIDKAINKYGEKHFYYEVIEEQIENFDEREKYWIEKYNSIYPNGYNLLIETNFIKNESQLYAIIDELINTENSFSKIGKNNNVTPNFVSSINKGTIYYDKSIEYPLRNIEINSETFKRLVYSLKYELNKTLNDISKEYNIDISHLKDIDQGKSYFKDWLIYPIRSDKIVNSLSKDVPQMIKLLQTTDLSQKEIARKFNIGVSAISNINLGKLYKQDNIKYPIRENCQSNKRKSFSPDEINEIEYLLRSSTLSMRSIAKRYETVVNIIMGINNGFIKKYHKDNLVYPIRKR